MQTPRARQGAKAKGMHTWRNYRIQPPRGDDERKGRASIQGKMTASMRARMWGRNKSSLEHIEQNHMFKGRKDKSVFITTKLCDIYVLVHKTMSYPDRVTVDRSNVRENYMKSFTYTNPVGVHGFSGAKCHTVKVVFDKRIQQVVTAYPIHP